MLIPIGAVKNIPITLLRVVQDPPLVIEGHIIYFDGRSYQITVSDAEAFQEGEQVLLDLGEGSLGRRRCRIKSASPAVIQVELLGRPRRRERREFPRIEGSVVLEYRAIEPTERHKLEAFMRHPHLSEAGEVWVKPDPFMEFSVTGLKFRCRETVEPGWLMCLRFRMPGVGPTTWACGAEVIRSELEDDGWYSMAVAFIGLGDDTFEALMEYTRYCQDLVLGLDSMYEE